MPATLGQLVAAVGAYATLASLLPVLHLDEMAVLGSGVLALGAGWVWLAWRRLVAENRLALAIAVTFRADWCKVGHGGRHRKPELHPAQIAAHIGRSERTVRCYWPPLPTAMGAG